MSEKILRKTKSLCPECMEVIEADVVEKDGKALIQKKCPKHGKFEDIYYSDAEIYKRFEKFAEIGDGVENPRTEEQRGCPFDCGICPNHKSHTVLAIIDVTNRCDLRCKICFANAAAAGYVYEPTFEQIKEMLRNLRANKPTPPPAIQFSVDGEETIFLRDENGVVRTEKIGDFIDSLMEGCPPELCTNPIKHEKCVAKGWEVLTLTDDFRTVFRPINHILRHEASEDLFKIRVDGGWEITATGSHSVITIDKNTGSLIQKRVVELSEGDYLIGCTRLPPDFLVIDSIDLLQLLSSATSEEKEKIRICDIPTDVKQKLPEHELSWQKRRSLERDSIPMEEFLRYVEEYGIPKEGGSIRWRNSTPEKKLPIKLPVSPHLCRLAGYYASEGCVYNHGIIFSFGLREEKLVEDLKECIRKMFGRTNIRVVKGTHEIQVYVEGYLYKFLFRRLLGAGENANTKKVPWFIFHVGDDLKMEFLKAYHRGDGHVKCRKTGFEINYSTVSRALASGLILLHMQLGVIPKIEQTSAKPHRLITETGQVIFKKSRKYCIVLGGKNQLLRMLPVLDDDLIQKFRDYIFQSRETHAPKFKRMPLEMLGLKNLSRKPLPIKDQRVKYLLRRTKYDRTISIDKLREITEYLEEIHVNPVPTFPKLREIANGDASILMVRKKERVKSSRKHVYDLSVEGTERFFCGAGTVLAHNSGGEPTLRDDLPDIVRAAKEAGFWHVEVNTNGIRLAKDLDFVKRLREAGVSTIYLQFDGVTPEPTIEARGADILPLKFKAIENCRKAGLTSMVLVVTLVRGINDDQVGDIIRFAAKNKDIIRCVNVQPVSFAGRISQEERERWRITIPDFMKAVEQQTGGQIKTLDFYPVPCMMPISRFTDAYTGRKFVKFTCHEHCGAATYVFVEDGNIIPVTRFVDIPKLFGLLDKYAEQLKKGGFAVKARVLARAVKDVPGTINMSKAPKGLNLPKIILNILRTGSYSALAEFHERALMIGCMHFMDTHNFCLDRAERCVIHYPVPDGRIIPFCTYNSIHRPEVERKLSVPIKEWKHQRKKR